MAEEYRFEMGRFHPTTLPMYRLAEYAKDLGSLFGSEEFVHLIRVEEGSAIPHIFVQSAYLKKVDQRLLSVRERQGPASALRAYDSINDRLSEDDSSATLHSPSGIALAFPGKLVGAEAVVGPVKEDGSLEGEIVEISGRDNSISIYLKDGDSVHRCSATRVQGRTWGKYVFSMVRVTGIGTWQRSESGIWKLLSFEVASLQPLKEESLSQSLRRLRSLAPTELPDPLA